MKFKIEDLTVVFPFKNVYPEQYEYMKELKHTLDSNGHAVLEMPTGTGKTVCLLSLITSYILEKLPTFKLVYCTRTVVEMEKVLEELKVVIAARLEEEGVAESKILAMCLSTRRNLCIHPVVSEEVDRNVVDRMCRARTASWVRLNAGLAPGTGLAQARELGLIPEEEEKKSEKAA